jgi:hypothetical protein
LAKDVLAMANSGGGHIIIGVEDKTGRKVGISKQVSESLWEAKNVNDKLKKYCGGFIRVLVAQYDLQDLAAAPTRLALISVPGARGMVPAQDNGVYPDPRDPAKQKWVFRQGDIYIRKGDESVKVETPEDLELGRMGSELEHGSPGVVRHFVAGKLPWPFIASEPFVDRDEAFAMLQSRLSPGAIVPVVGLPDSGKSQMVAHFLCDSASVEALERKFACPLSVLYVDLGSRLGVIRSLGFALGHSKLSSLSDVTANELTSEEYARTILVDEILPSRLRLTAPLAIFENSQVALAQSQGRLELDEILGSEVFRGGAAVVVARYGEIPTGLGRRAVKGEIVVDKLSERYADSLLRQLTGDGELSSSAVNEASGLEELLLPGVLVRGANEFLRRAEQGSVRRTTGALIDMLIGASQHVAQEVLSSLGIGNIILANGSLGPLSTLLVMAIVGEHRVFHKQLQASGLPEPPFRDLTKAGLIETDDHCYRLTAVARHGLRRQVEAVLGEESASAESAALTRALRSYVDALEQNASEDVSDRYTDALEEALTWLRHKLPREKEIRDILLQSFLPNTTDDTVFPLSKAECTSLQSGMATGAPQIGADVARLAILARSEPHSERFFEHLKHTSQLAQHEAQLFSHHVRGLDLALRIAARDARRHREVLVLRQSLIDILSTQAKHPGADVALIKGTISWILHAADLAVTTGHIEKARSHLLQSEVLIGQLPNPEAPHGIADLMSLKARQAELQAQVESDRISRVHRLRHAVSYAEGALLATGIQPQRIAFYLHSVRALVEELQTDRSRDEAIDRATNVLDQIHGGIDNWSLETRSRVSTLVRRGSSLNADPAQQLSRALRAFALLLPRQEQAVRLAALGEGEPLLALARSYFTISQYHELLEQPHQAEEARRSALNLCQRAVKSAPSTESWETFLRLKDKQISLSESFLQVEESPDGDGSIDPSLQQSIRECRHWLKSTNFRDTNRGNLEVWMLCREWRSEGSLIRRAKDQESLSELEWARIPAKGKLEIIEKLYRERRSALAVLEARYGAFLELYLAKTRLEAQFQRLEATYRDHIYDAEPTRRIFSTGLAAGLDFYALTEQEALFERRVWNFGGAIWAFRKALAGDPNGSRRREAAVEMVETLLTAAIHERVVALPDGSTLGPGAAIEEGRGILVNLLGFRHVAQKTAMLRDRVELEAGGRVDWASIDRMYDLVVGGTDSYLETVTRNLDELLIERPDLPNNLAEAVRQNCGTSDVLRGMALIYLRRAEITAEDEGSSSNRIADCERAYAGFNACSILERSWLGTELAVTRFQKAHTIFVAVSISRNLNPFPAALGRKKSLVNVAEALMQGAVDLSVGRFHTKCQELRRSLIDLNRELTNRPD